MRRRVHRDANHGAIAAALLAVGCSVLDLAAVGRGCPDLAVGRQGVTYLLEIKSGKRARKGEGWADEAHQRDWRAAWRGGPVVRVTSVDEALAAVGIAS